MAISTFNGYKVVDLSNSSNSNINRADVFVVPNRAWNVPANEEIDSWNQHILDRNNRKFQNMNLRYNGEIVECHSGDTLVEIWVAGMGCENWQDHGVPEELGVGVMMFPNYIPLRILENAKEGDEIEFTINDNDKLILRCAQTEYRYRNWGKFETAVACVI